MADHRLLKYFKYEHLPHHLQDISKPFCDLARALVYSIELNDPAEQTTALRKLLEAKDAAVRAAIT